ncbi:MAG: tRNA uridine-5-carboxymethylaminomethyl(34) synthesis GTPase MnmE [Dysgonamonadaceae bacterium]|jgi:tRNA modification GTPase|nr:tRNA uridine-5-carboxymethylaminomethyl(34) synthesis GTPase MnmE [Dysgonamonadaceae bacterium]
MDDTICAISTAPGVGGIAVIRISGNDAIEICDKIFKGRKRLSETESNKVVFGTIVSRNDEIIDDVLITVFRTPHSFTGEDTVEISCHGSIYIQQKIVELLLDKGARLAQAGEFTRRAFRNGKFDLSQAEAVADLIASSSQASHRVAMNQMRGGFAQKLVELRDKLLQFVSLIELELDFSEEDVEFANREKLYELTQEIETNIARLTDSFQLGNVIKSGIPVAIIGETNAGKSTLLNLLLNEEKAIVSDIHGTTRDVIEDTMNIGGVTFRFIDTAGIRQTTDTIESLGIERTFRKIEQASIVLWLIDLMTPPEQIEALAVSIVPKLANKHVMLVFNKADLFSNEEIALKNNILPQIKAERLFISAKNRQNIEQLQHLLVKSAEIPVIGEEDVIVTNLRHYEALSKALEAIRRAKECLELNISYDFLSQDIRECSHFLGEIVGSITNDEILGNIFEKFCIGK